MDVKHLDGSPRPRARMVQEALLLPDEPGKREARKMLYPEKNSDQHRPGA